MHRSHSAAALAVLVAMACSVAVTVDDGLEGAWTVAEVSFSSSDTTWTNMSPQPSLYIFAEQHYSVMYVPGDEPRPLYANGSWPPDAPPTEAEKVLQYDTIIANSGTYEVSDSTLTMRPMVAKNPNFMTHGVVTVTHQVEGDMLTLTSRSDDGAVSRTVLRRVE